MSENVAQKGFLKYLKDGNMKDFVLELIKNKEISIPDHYNPEEDYRDIFYDILDEEYYIDEKDSKIYKVEKEDLDIYDDIFECEEIEKNKYSFFVKYYNGGCSFSEAIDKAMQKMKKNKLNINDIKFKDLNVFWKEIENGNSFEEHFEILKEFQKKYNLTDKEIIKFSNMRYQWNN